MKSGPEFEPARDGDPILHDGVTVAGTLVADPCSARKVMVEGRQAIAAGATVPCSGATSGGPLHPPAPAKVIANLPNVLVDGKPLALRTPAPDLTSCGAMIGDPKRCGTSSVVVGIYEPSKGCPPEK